MEFLRQLFSGIVQAWKQLSLSARINIVVAATAVMVAIAVVALAGAKPQYITLSSSVEADKLKKVTDLLTQNAIPYRLENNNADVTVPLEYRSKGQLLLAGNDLPVGRPVPPGFEIFQQTELMTNQWLQDVKFMRALQGEIQRQLNAFDFVNYSYVLIREAKEELFANDQKPSEASVVLDTKRPLTKQEVKAVVSIVDHGGGANLHSGNITVTTTKGEVLYMPPESEYASLANSKLELVSDWEKQRETKLTAKLRELGIRGTVSVGAKLDFDEKEKTEEKVAEGTQLSTMSTSNTTTNTEKPAEGAAGAVTNLPEGAAAPGGTNSQEENTEEITNFEPSRTTTKTKTHPGDVLQFVVSMIVEGDYKETVDAQGKKTREYVALPEDRKQALTDLAKATVGEGQTPTTVTIFDQPFNIDQISSATTAVEEARTSETWINRMQYMWTGLQIMGIILGFFLIRMLLRRAIEAPAVEEEEEEVVPIPEATREDLRRQEVAQEIGRLASEDPEIVAALLRSWLAEENE